MDMSSLFPSDTNNNSSNGTDDDSSSSQVHVSFNAGILNLDRGSRRMNPDPRRGKFEIRTSLDDGLVHIQWKPCDGDVEKDLIMINGETRMKQVMSCPASARVYVLSWRESDTRMFLWMQERDATEDAARVSVVNNILENGPAAGAGGLQQQDVHDEDHTTMQQAGDNDDDPMDDTIPSSSIPAAAAAATTTTPASATPPLTSRATSGATDPSSSSTTTAAAAVDGVTTTNAAGGTTTATATTAAANNSNTGRSTAITLEQVRAALSSGASNTHLQPSSTNDTSSNNTLSLLHRAQALANAQASLTPTPRDLLQSDLLSEALRDPAVVDGLQTLVDDVPPDDRSIAGVREVLHSPELESQAASLSMALTSGHDADDLLRGLGIDIDVAAGSGVGFGFGGFGGNSAAVLVTALKRIQRERQQTAGGASKSGNTEKKEGSGN